MVFFLFFLPTLGSLSLVLSDLPLFFSTSGFISGCGEGLLVFFKGFSYGPKFSAGWQSGTSAKQKTITSVYHKRYNAESGTEPTEIEAMKRHHLQWIEGYNDNYNNKDNFFFPPTIMQAEKIY